MAEESTRHGLARVRKFIRVGLEDWRGSVGMRKVHSATAPRVGKSAGTPPKSSHSSCNKASFVAPGASYSGESLYLRTRGRPYRGPQSAGFSAGNTASRPAAIVPGHRCCRGLLTGLVTPRADVAELTGWAQYFP
ncbi:hypothetical protein BHM03_00029675 [Ensete ventricosum]|uniref:Uncharacterized protein n=1 Tax=Ensete ventricosum TaxID=4639 RepID=A0A445MI25_ENSVE|nr:hypothetical protein BHM03_00029675 [Ensete ventricosum]